MDVLADILAFLEARPTLLFDPGAFDTDAGSSCRAGTGFGYMFAPLIALAFVVAFSLILASKTPECHA